MSLAYITNLISTFGESALLNDNVKKVYIKKIKESEYNIDTHGVRKDLNSFIIKRIYVRGQLKLTDIFKFDNNEDEYRIYSIETIKEGGKIGYNDVLLFKDDFTRIINIYISDNRDNSTYPILVKKVKTEIKARLLTLTPYDTSQMLNIMDIPSTNAFVIFYTADVKENMVIEYNEKYYQINKIENINENDTLLKLYVTNTVRLENGIPEGETEGDDGYTFGARF